MYIWEVKQVLELLQSSFHKDYGVPLFTIAKNLLESKPENKGTITITFMF